MQNLNPKPFNLQQRCYQFSLRIISLTGQVSTGSLRPLSDQLFRSGTSIGANITEAKASSSRLEFKKFQEIALKSANETVYWLSLLKDSKNYPQLESEVNFLTDECTQLSRMIASGIIKLKSGNKI